MKRKRTNGRRMIRNPRTTTPGAGNGKALLPSTLGRHRNHPHGLYSMSIDNQVYQLGAQGWTNKKIAKFYNVGESTFNKWLRDSPTLREALDSGRIDPGLEVRAAMMKRALGYEYTEIHIETKKIRDKKTGRYIELEVGRRTVTKHVLPNVTAQIFLLKARHPEEWSEAYKVITDVNINLHQQLDLKDFTTEELKFLRKMGLKRLTDATNN